MNKIEVLYIDEYVQAISSKLVEYELKKSLSEGIILNLKHKYIKPTLQFLSSQDKSVPVGALLGTLVSHHEDKIIEALVFIEAMYDLDFIRIYENNGNWIIMNHPLSFHVNPQHGIYFEPPSVDTPYCGTTMHNPKPYRTDHLKHLNSIEFKLNQEFIDAVGIENIPPKVPFKKTLPAILEDLEGLTFFLEHRQDFRGRTYNASHLNYQGTQYEKALLEFAKPIKLTAEGYQNIDDYIAGLKEDEACQKFTALQAKTSKKTGIMIGADARTSGMQILAVLAQCPISAFHVGLLDKQNDAYTVAAQNANFDFSNSGWWDSSSQSIDRDVNPRDIFKPCCMQHFYGGVKTPKTMLGEDNYKEFIKLLKEYFPGCESAKKIIQNSYIKTDVFKWKLPDGFVAQAPTVKTKRIELWLPNFPHVKFGYAYKTIEGKEKGIELAANVVHSVDGYIAREMVYRAMIGGNIDEMAIKRALKVTAKHDKPEVCFSLYRLLNTDKELWGLFGKSYLEKALAYAQVVKDMPSFNIISVHDDFKCHPNYVKWMKILYIEILADIADSQLLKQILNDINPNAFVPFRGSKVFANTIREAVKSGVGVGIE